MTVLDMVDQLTRSKRYTEEPRTYCENVTGNSDILPCTTVMLRATCQKLHTLKSSNDVKKECFIQRDIHSVGPPRARYASPPGRPVHTDTISTSQGAFSTLQLLHEDYSFTHLQSVPTRSLSSLVCDGLGLVSVLGLGLVNCYGWTITTSLMLP